MSEKEYWIDNEDRIIEELTDKLKRTPTQAEVSNELHEQYVDMISSMGDELADAAKYD